MKNHDFHKGKMVAVRCFSKIHFRFEAIFHSYRIRRRRAESAFSADSARRANLAVSGVGAPVEIFDGGDLMKNHDFH